VQGTAVDGLRSIKDIPDSSFQEEVRRMKIEKAIRRVLPATARLTYNPIFKMLVDSLDVIPKRMYQELAKIPPNHMRIRIGVGNRILANHVIFVTGSKDFWMHAFHAGLCRLDSTIIDIGSGCGRYAHPLRDYHFKSERFSGRYIGIDIDEEMLEWCRRNFDAERFTFHQSIHASKAYRVNANSNGHTYYELPVEDASADFVFSTSLFTHLLEQELINYCQESYRVLKPGGHMSMFCFSMDHPPPTFGDRHTFRHRMGNAYVESLQSPEAAVAYHESFLFEVARQVGFRSAEIQTAAGDWQPALLCQK
jgi:SAM-dependent methyltransferase